jgi:hypothetical protein
VRSTPSVLERLGIEPHTRQLFRLADGSTIESLGYVLDAIRRDLIPLPMVLASA